MTPTKKTHLMDRKTFNLTRKAVIEACAKGIGGNLIGDNLRLNLPVRFSDGYKSSLVACMELNIQMVVKHGGREIIGEAGMMQEINSQRPKLFPEVFRTYQIGDDSYGMILENMTGYSTLYYIIYEDKTPIPPEEIRLISKNLFDRLERHYTANCRSDTPVDIVEIYTKRIGDKINQAMKGEFADILKAEQIIVKGEEFKNPLKYLNSFNILDKSRRIHKITHFIHGDPHIGNILVKRQKRKYSIKLIDPNPDRGYSDYLYDIGKLYHWIEEVGFINYEDHGEREGIRRPAIKAKSRIKDSKLQISLSIYNTPEIEDIQSKRKEFLTHLDRWTGHLSRSMKDRDARWRIHLSIASAHAGLLPVLKKKSAFLLAYAKMLHHLKIGLIG